MAQYEVQTITLSSGRTMPAALLICPVCKVLDMGVDVNTGKEPWVATCTKGHQWDVDAREQA